MKALIETILDINSRSFKWYLLLSLILFIIKFPIPQFLLVVFLAISGVLKLYHDKPTLPKIILPKDNLILLPLSLILTLLAIFLYGPAINLTDTITQTTGSKLLGQGLLFLLFFFVLLATFKDEKAN